MTYLVVCRLYDEKGHGNGDPYVCDCPTVEAAVTLRTHLAAGGCTHLDIYQTNATVDAKLKQAITMLLMADLSNEARAQLTKLGIEPLPIPPGMQST